MKDEILTWGTTLLENERAWQFCMDHGFYESALHAANNIEFVERKIASLLNNV